MIASIMKQGRNWSPWFPACGAPSLLCAVVLVRRPTGRAAPCTATNSGLQTIGMQILAGYYW